MSSSDSQSPFVSITIYHLTSSFFSPPYSQNYMMPIILLSSVLLFSGTQANTSLGNLSVIVHCICPYHFSCIVSLCSIILFVLKTLILLNIIHAINTRRTVVIVYLQGPYLSFWQVGFICSFLSNKFTFMVKICYYSTLTIFL